MPVSAIKISGLTKTFGDVKAVAGVDLEIAEGEFFSMLGPSGSGKTTVLRLIAGFEQPTSGTIELFGEDVSSKPPFERAVNTVFQDYALFPHMSVLENVEYGLRVRKIGREEREKKAREALAMVRLEGYDARRPNQLSGGQRQRVALARALVVKPKALLLDEPLGALDLKLREEMQVELKQIQRELGITFIFVTHDQAEALSLSNRVAVFSEGKIVQVGSPEEIYNHPANAFVADFVGTSNYFSADEAKALFGIESAVVVRPEQIEIGVDASRQASKRGAGEVFEFNGKLVETNFLGNINRYLVRVDGGKELVATRTNEGSEGGLKRGDAVSLLIPKGALSQLRQ